MWRTLLQILGFSSTSSEPTASVTQPEYDDFASIKEPEPQRNTASYKEPEPEPVKEEAAKEETETEPVKEETEIEPVKEETEIEPVKEEPVEEKPDTESLPDLVSDPEPVKEETDIESLPDLVSDTDSEPEPFKHLEPTPDPIAEPTVIADDSVPFPEPTSQPTKRVFPLFAP